MGAFYRPGNQAGRIESRRTTAMSNKQRQTPRKPATKFMQLRKKMQKAKTQAKAVKKGKK